MSAMGFPRSSFALGKHRAAKNAPRKAKYIRDAICNTDHKVRMKEDLSLSSGETAKRREHSSVTESCGI